MRSTGLLDRLACAAWNPLQYLEGANVILVAACQFPAATCLRAAASESMGCRLPGAATESVDLTDETK